MKILTVMVIIERDPMTKIPKEVFPWEVPLLRAQYGDEKVEILEGKNTTFATVDELPDAQEEWMRLRQQYGIEPDTKQSIVDIAYGRGEIGIEALEKVIKKAKLSDSVGEASKGRAKKAVDPRDAIESAQELVDGGKLDEEKADARENAYRDPLDDELVHQSNNDVLGAAAGGPGKSE